MPATKLIATAFVKTMWWVVITTFFAFLPISAAAFLVAWAPTITDIKSVWLIPDWLFVSTTLIATTATDYIFGSHRPLPRLIEGPMYFLFPAAITFFIALIYVLEHLPSSITVTDTNAHFSWIRYLLSGKNGDINVENIHALACIMSVAYAFIGKFGQFALEPQRRP